VADQPLEWVTKNAPDGIQIHISVIEGKGRIEITATSDDGQILHMQANAGANDLRTLGQMAFEAAGKCT
jgi:hypothetical protein